MVDEMFKHAKMHLEYLKLSMKTALEYRTNFIVQSISMLVNDCIWIIFWLIFFNKFSQIRGWTMSDMILLYSVLLVAYGIRGILLGNSGRIAKIIVEGRLDYYITLPKNILYHLISSKSSWYDVGDFLLGVILAILFVPLVKLPLLLLLIILSATIIIAFEIITGSIAFYIGNSEETCMAFRNALIAFASYPFRIFDGIAKIILLLVIPAGFVTGVPVELLKSFDATWLMYMIGFTLIITIIAIIVFYNGLKRYESGNLLYVNT
jgi:ABC-2 type transport system permease protein